MKKIIKYIFLFLILGLVYIVYTNYPRLNIVTGFASKSIASGVFLANRTQESVEKGDNDFSPIDQAKNKVNLSEQLVISSLHGLKKRKAIYRKGLGAVLIDDDYNINEKVAIPNRDRTKKDLPFPYGNSPQIDNEFINVDYNVLQKAVENAFDKGDEKLKRSRSVLVVYKDQIIAEKYANGFDKNTRYYWVGP